MINHLNVALKCTQVCSVVHLSQLFENMELLHYVHERMSCVFGGCPCVH
jgi:hypothetical protein